MSTTEIYTYGADGIKLRIAKVVLTDAQIKALPTTPITMVAAQGSGKFIVPVSLNLELNATSGGYSNINGYSWIALSSATSNDASGYIGNDNTISPAMVNLTNFLSSANHRATQIPVPATWSDPGGWGVLAAVQGGSISVFNSALTIYADNSGSGNFTGGNAANSLIVTTLYLVL